MTRKIKNKIELILVALMFVLIMGIVSADVCCEKTTAGAWCQNAPEAECDSSLGYQISPNACEDTAFCETGCCFDSVEGLCTTSPEQRCIDGGGYWDDDENCNAQRCQEGCCMWGSNTQFVTETRCEYISLSDGYINSSISEVDCRFFSEAEGACILDVGGCMHTTEEDCVIALEGTFYDGYCSTAPGVDCSAGASTKCAEEENLYDVYNFDSCNNREDVATECNYPSEKCVNGACEDLSCTDEEGNLREHLESWCVYDAYVGDSRDIVGSKHWKRYCEDGKVKVKQCADYRNQICAEKVIEGISTAQCRTNLGFMCYRTDDEEECEDEPDCRMENVYVDRYFYFDVCVPKYPIGFDVNSEDDEKNGKDICGLATQTCTMVYQKEPIWRGGDYKCKGNCECRKYGFAKQMNDFCISLGDCGGYVNLEEKYNQGFGISGKYEGGGLNTADIDKYESYLTKGNTEENTPPFLFSADNDGSYGDELNRFNIAAGEYEYEESDFIKGARYAAYANIAFWAFWTFGATLVLAPFVDEILLGVFGGKTKKKTATFTCLPWKPPVGGDDCSTCNENPLKPCTEYRCSSLGAACGLINTDYQYPICIDKYPDDEEYPIISLGKVLTEGYKFTNETATGVGIRTETTEECIQEFTVIGFSLNTSEYAWCKFNFSTTNWNDYETTGEYSNEGNELTKNHTFEIRTHYLNTQYVDSSGNLNMYIRCQDPAGNLNLNEYVVNFCIIEGPDYRPPEIIRAEPESGSFLEYEVTESGLEIYLDEPADCKYDVVENTDYDYMSNDFTCELYEEGDIPQVEYSCLTIPAITGLTETENKIYIKCRDHPEFEDDEDETNDDDRNTNPQDYPYILYATENKLKIDSISPENGSIIEKSMSDRNIDLEVTTSGGMNNDGVSECEYKFIGKVWGAQFLETNAVHHKQTFTSLPGGSYKINVTCKDDAGNLATKITEFTLSIDTTPPNITYEKTEEGNPILIDGNLILTTDEDAECYYDITTGCGFGFDDGGVISMTTGWLDTGPHIIYNFDPKEDYHVGCADGWDNSACITIKATETDDGTAPVVVRAYHEGSNLKLITNKKAKCYYNLDDCDFDFDDDDVTSMTDDFSTEHTADWNLGWTYHIRCKDDFDNPNEGCAIIIKQVI